MPSASSLLVLVLFRFELNLCYQQSTKLLSDFVISSRKGKACVTKNVSQSRT